MKNSAWNVAARVAKGVARHDGQSLALPIIGEAAEKIGHWPVPL